MELSHLAVNFRTKASATRKSDQHADTGPDRLSTGIGDRNGGWKYKGEWDAPENPLDRQPDDAVVAGAVRDIMDEKRRDGIAAARAKSVKFGRPRLVNAQFWATAATRPTGSRQYLPSVFSSG